MRLSLRVALVSTCIVSIAVLASAALARPAVRAQEENPASRLLELVNQARLDQGLNPYSWSRLLSQAAQRHTEDLAERGVVNSDDEHLGSDGSDEQERVEETGYSAWTQDGDPVVAESVWSGRGGADEVLTSLYEDPEGREKLISEMYREIGIGVAIRDDGRAVYVLVFGARPNVLPVFINDGADVAEHREVAIRLTNERVRPQGQGNSFIGEAIEIRISNEPSFEGLEWQPWAPLVSWTLPDRAGQHTVYVQFRDAAGRTAASAASIVLGEGTLPPSTDVPLTATPTTHGTGTAPPISPTRASDDVPLSPTSAVQAPALTTPSPSASAPLASGATPYPTWTPLPSPEPTPAALEVQEDAVLSLPSLKDYRRPLTLASILQGVAIVLGAYWMLRRGKRP